MNKKEFEALCNLSGYEVREIKTAWRLLEVLIARKDSSCIGKISKAGLMKCAKIRDQRTLMKAGKLLLDLGRINDNFEIVE